MKATLLLRALAVVLLVLAGIAVVAGIIVAADPSAISAFVVPSLAPPAWADAVGLLAFGVLGFLGSYGLYGARRWAWWLWVALDLAAFLASVVETVLGSFTSAYIGVGRIAAFVAVLAALLLAEADLDY